MSSPTTDLDQPASRCFQLDPIRDPRWAEFVDTHPKAAVFHTVRWLEALRATYGYEPLVFTTSPPGVRLKNGILFCRINSWLTGRRLVSLPFSDHCEPLCDSTSDLKSLVRYLQAFLQQDHGKYFEIRPLSGDLGQLGAETGCAPVATYFLHRLDLGPDLAELFRSLDH